MIGGAIIGGSLFALGAIFGAGLAKSQNRTPK